MNCDKCDACLERMPERLPWAAPHWICPSCYSTYDLDGNMSNNCDMCGAKIEGDKCSCGEWKSAEEMQDCPMKKSLEKFHEMKQFTFTGDAPHLGCAVVFFRGDYNDCKKVEKYIHQMKRRPFYE